jgi:hypothetical protein
MMMIGIGTPISQSSSERIQASPEGNALEMAD